MGTFSPVYMGLSQWTVVNEFIQCSMVQTHRLDVFISSFSEKLTGYYRIVLFWTEGT